MTQQFGGMGLGLAIAKAVVDLHGGTISAHSDGEGKGAVFTVSLPLTVAGAPPAPTPGNGEPVDAARRPIRVLLVEDHADTAKVLVRLLRTDGSEVRWAGSVAAALEAAAAEPFDIVVSDLGLPDGSGHDLIRRLRRDRPVLGIAMSGYGMEDDVRRSREAGFVEHLVKPVSLPQLREAIRRVASTRVTRA